MYRMPVEEAEPPKAAATPQAAVEKVQHERMCWQCCMDSKAMVMAEPSDDTHQGRCPGCQCSSQQVYLYRIHRCKTPEPVKTPESETPVPKFACLGCYRKLVGYDNEEKNKAHNGVCKCGIGGTLYKMPEPPVSAQPIQTGKGSLVCIACLKGGKRVPKGTEYSLVVGGHITEGRCSLCDLSTYWMFLVKPTPKTTQEVVWAPPHDLIRQFAEAAKQCETPIARLVALRDASDRLYGNTPVVRDLDKSRRELSEIRDEFKEKASWYERHNKPKTA